MKNGIVMIKKICIVCALFLFLLPSGGDMYARKKTKKGEPAAQTDTVRKLTKYEKLFKKDHKVARGMIDLHLLDGKVYFEMPVSLLGREMVMGSTIKSISDNANGVVGSKPLELLHFTFTRQDSTIRMQEINTDYMSDDLNIVRALSSGHSSTIIKAMPVAAYNADSSSVVFNVTDIFLSHDEKMSPFSEFAAYSSYNRTESFKKDRSFIEDVKAFGDNVSVTSSLSYTYSMTDGKGKSLLKDKPLTAELVRSILLLPEKTYHPRMADWRIGVFFTERTQFGGIASTSKPVYFANRWRMEPSDTAAYRSGMPVEPVKPIVFYIDSNFPEWWKPYIREAVEQWQEPFEAIGFRNAVIAKDFPADDPEFDPDNIKYSCIRYAPIGIQNAMGPSWVDPRSGEIINASVYVYHDIVQLITRWRFVQTAQADKSVRAAALPEDILGDAIRYVVSHEVGHCLGFMHNMSASSVIPVESLRDPEFTSKNGTTTSIMDYARFNYVAQPGDMEKGVKMTPPRFGSYDNWVVRWAYTPVFDAASFEEEAAITSGWITDSLAVAPFYRYGKQQISSVLFDPRCQNEDLGDDAVKATKYGVVNLKYIMSEYMDWIEGDEDYEFRTEIYNGIINQYLTYAQHVLFNVGGLYKNELKAVDNVPPYQNIPAAKQKEALAYLFTLAEDLDWLGDKAVLGRLPVVGAPAEAVRDAVYDMIMLTPYFASMSDGVATEEFSAKDCLSYIYDKVWKSSKAGRRLTRAEKALQKTFVSSLMQLGGFSVPESKRNIALSDDGCGLSCEPYPDACCGLSDKPYLAAGEISYDPVGGYEWNPRYIFNRGQLTRASLYAFLIQARDLMKNRMSGAAAEDRAHYELLVKTIEYGLK